MKIKIKENIFLGDKFKQIECNCSILSKASILPDFCKPEYMTSFGQFAHIYTICHHSVFTVWRVTGFASRLTFPPAQDAL